MKLSVLLLLALLGQFGQAEVGELHVIAVDQQAGVIPGAAVSIDSDASQTHRSIVTGGDGLATAKRLPFGVYRITITLPGFQTTRAIVEIRTATPIEQRIPLPIAGPVMTIEEA